jgi:cell division protein FtsZ
LNQHTHKHIAQINAAAEVIYEAVDPNANIIFGALVDESMNGEIAITVIATGFPVGTMANSLSGEHCASLHSDSPISLYFLLINHCAVMTY